MLRLAPALLVIAGCASSAASSSAPDAPVEPVPAIQAEPRPLLDVTAARLDGRWQGSVPLPDVTVDYDLWFHADGMVESGDVRTWKIQPFTIDGTTITIAGQAPIEVVELNERQMRVRIDGVTAALTRARPSIPGQPVPLTAENIEGTWVGRMERVDFGLSIRGSVVGISVMGDVPTDVPFELTDDGFKVGNNRFVEVILTTNRLTASLLDNGDGAPMKVYLERL